MGARVRVRPKLEFYWESMQINTITSPSPPTDLGGRLTVFRGPHCTAPPRIQPVDERRFPERLLKIPPLIGGCLNCNFARGRLSFHHRSARECHSLWVFVSFHVYKSPRTRQVRAAMRGLLSRSVGPSRDYRGINLRRGVPDAPARQCSEINPILLHAQAPTSCTTDSLSLNRLLTRPDSSASFRLKMAIHYRIWNNTMANN